jgi:hypothetical protein
MENEMIYRIVVGLKCGINSDCWTIEAPEEVHKAIIEALQDPNYKINPLFSCDIINFYNSKSREPERWMWEDFVMILDQRGYINCHAKKFVTSSRVNDTQMANSIPAPIEIINQDKALLIFFGVNANTQAIPI